MPGVPSTIKNDHDYLLARIHTISLYEDSTGRVAFKAYELMQHHFKEEEDNVLPPLGLLPLLASGKLPVNINESVRLSGQVKSQLNHLSAEHQLISAFMDELKQVALKEDHQEIAEFESALQKHAKLEEEILFPTAILIGEYLKLKGGGNQK